jgi:ribosomal protein S18 acetylase RimI-like enzyme
MEPLVRAARPDDDAAGLLYESAAPYYAAFAGGEARARRLLAALYPRGGHMASWDICRVAEVDGRIVGVLAAFPAREGDRLARHFLKLAVARLPPWQWPRMVRHLRASSAVSPVPPPGALYVDALAVAPAARRRGVARALLADAERLAAEAGATGVALDTGLANAEAQALYEASGFERGAERRAPDERTARAVGGPGFVSFFRPLAR